MPKPLPRTHNVFTRDGKPIVAKAPHLNGDYLPDSVGTALDLLGGLSKAIRPGDRVMVKPNFNCSYAFPLSTDRAFLAAAIEILQDAGAHVTVGEMCGRADWPTEKVIRNLKIMPVLERYGVRVRQFRARRVAADGDQQPLLADDPRAPLHLRGGEARLPGQHALPLVRPVHGLAEVVRRLHVAGGSRLPARRSPAHRAQGAGDQPGLAARSRAARRPPQHRQLGRPRGIRLSERRSWLRATWWRWTSRR